MRTITGSFQHFYAEELKEIGEENVVCFLYIGFKSGEVVRLPFASKEAALPVFNGVLGSTKSSHYQIPLAQPTSILRIRPDSVAFASVTDARSADARR